MSSLRGQKEDALSVRIINLVTTTDKSWWTNGEIGNRLNAPLSQVSSTTNRMWKRGWLNRKQSRSDDGLPWLYARSKKQLAFLSEK